MNITVSMNFKRISIDCFTSINFDDIDLDKNMIFVWFKDNIVGSIVLPNNEDVDINFWVNNREYKSFDNYQDFRKFYNEEYKNLV